MHRTRERLGIVVDPIVRDQNHHILKSEEVNSINMSSMFFNDTWSR